MIVGMLMLPSMAKIDFDDFTELVPAFANGLTAGLVLYPIVKALAGRWRDVKPGAGAVALALLCAVYYVFGLPH